MCSGSRRKVGPNDLAMGGEIIGNEILLELSANDDLSGFKMAVEEEGFDVNMSGFWYGRRIGSKKMCYEKRTPLMIASTFGSKNVLNYIVEKGCTNINQTCGFDLATALHCAVSGGSSASLDVVKLLLDCSADVDLVDANGNRPADLISSCRFTSQKKKMMEQLLKGNSSDTDEGYGLIDQETFEKIEDQQVLISPNAGSEKKEYPIDPSLPDIKNSIYGTDDFRMYTFKVKPCSRAYSHDWTECPFVHPGENARRRDPRKYHYSCVPCPDFRKGACQRGDSCDYSHGIFECWLHPSQYRTRMCKDDTNCNRRVCFFAHKPNELRPSYASTVPNLPSPRSYSLGASPFDIASISPLALSSPSIMTTPTLQFHGSRLKTTLNARDMDLDVGILGLDHLRQDQLVNDISAVSSPSSWNKISATSAAFGDHSGDFSRPAGLTPNNFEDVFGTLDPNMLSQMRQNMSHSSSPTRTSSPSFRMQGVLNSRSDAFAKRSHSFIDRSGLTSSPISTGIAMQSSLSGWGSPDGKLDWGIKKEELCKFRKSVSFGTHSFANGGTSLSTTCDEPNDLWAANSAQFSMENQQYCLNKRGGSEMHPTWIDHEQILA